MIITKHFHSCVSLHDGDDSLLFDPGDLTFHIGKIDPNSLTATEIFISHRHPDHIDPHHFKMILAKNPESRVLVNHDTMLHLDRFSIRSEPLDKDPMDSRNAIFQVQALPAEHNPVIEKEIPENTAYLINERILFVGDSLSESLYQFEGVEVLILPITAPHLTEVQVADFIKRLKPQKVIPVHDGYIVPYFQKKRYDTFENFCREIGVEFDRLFIEDSIEIPSYV